MENFDSIKIEVFGAIRLRRDEVKLQLEFREDSTLRVFSFILQVLFLHMDRLERAKPSPWKGSEQFLSSEASFPILLPIYLVTLPRQREIQGKCLPLTACVFGFVFF